MTPVEKNAQLLDKAKKLARELSAARAVYRSWALVEAHKRDDLDELFKLLIELWGPTDALEEWRRKRGK